MSTRRSLVSTFAGIAALTLACGRGAPPGEQAAPAAWDVTVQPLTIAAAAGSGAPQLTTSPKGVMVSWLERTGDTNALKFAERTATGWSEPRTAAAGKGWFVSWADAPSVQRLSDGTLIADWFVSTREELEAYNTLLSYSNDDGKTWARPFSPHRDMSQTQHGFPTLVEMPDRQVGLIWLDGRDMATNTTDPEGGVMSLRFTSFDKAWKQAPDVEVNKRVCECCQTSAVMTPDGLVAAFRDRSDKEVRDIMVSRLEGSTWTAPQPVAADNYVVDSCPVNGPALSARGRDLAAAWFTVKNDKGQAYAAFSRDAGRTWSSPQRLDGGESVGHVDIEWLNEGSAVATWVEFADRRQRLTMRRVDMGGQMSPPIVVAGAEGPRVTGYPRLAQHEGELVLAWMQNAGGQDGAEGETQVVTAAVKVGRQ